MNLPNSNYETALQANKGAYIVEGSDVTPDLLLVANGSEVATLVEGAALIRKEMGINIQIIS